MEECEALCSRLIIMVNGNICCIGSPLHLKNKFGNSYTVQIKISPGEMLMQSSFKRQQSRDSTGMLQRQRSRVDSLKTYGNKTELNKHIEEVKRFMADNFPTSTLKATHNNLLHYIIHNTNESTVKCSRIFGLIESSKELLKIEDYSVCQTNLEQIFLSFARCQRESKEQNK